MQKPVSDADFPMLLRTLSIGQGNPVQAADERNISILSCFDTSLPRERCLQGNRRAAGTLKVAGCGQIYLGGHWRPAVSPADSAFEMTGPIDAEECVVGISEDRYFRKHFDACLETVKVQALDGFMFTRGNKTKIHNADGSVRATLAPLSFASFGNAYRALRHEAPTNHTFTLAYERGTELSFFTQWLKHLGKSPSA